MVVGGAGIAVLIAGGEEIAGMVAGVAAGVVAVGGPAGDMASTAALSSEPAQSFATRAQRDGAGAARTGGAVFGDAAANKLGRSKPNDESAERCCRRRKQNSLIKPTTIVLETDNDVR